LLLKNRYKINFILLAGLLFYGCGLQSTFVRDDFNKKYEAPENEDIAYRILLIGDAGEPSLEFREPVLNALEIQANIIPERTTIFFLGDNIYPYGLDDPDTELRIISESRLKEQIKVAENSGASAVFIPGNHDWDRGGPSGWIKIKRQADFIDSTGNSKIMMLPREGCPGPEILDYGSFLRVIIIDTQWWLHEFDKPDSTNSSCTNTTKAKVLSALDSAFKTSDGRFVIVAAHHPLNTYGPHGGHFDWTEHIFPLTNLHPYLWIPLPVIGSLYPVSRWMGVTNQDLSNYQYKELIKDFESVLSKYSNWAYASGHEHSVQVLEGINNNFYLISGFGTSIHTSNVSKGDKTIFADVKQGFMQVDILKNKKARLGIYRVDEESENWIEVFSLMLN
jgi:hypothetical protein